MALKKAMAPVVSEDTEQIGGKVFQHEGEKRAFLYEFE